VLDGGVYKYTRSQLALRKSSEKNEDIIKRRASHKSNRSNKKQTNNLEDIRKFSTL
jgi:hypothetical protein